MGSVRELADSFHERWLATHPFAASMYGIPGYDGRVPDDSEAGEAAWQDELGSVLAQVRRTDEAHLSEADEITLGCLVENVGEEQRDLDARLIEHTVTAMPFGGPAVLFAIAARTVIGDPQAAGDYLERLRAGGGWIDQQSERLRIGAGKGRLPVGPLVQQAIEWAEGLLGSKVPEALATPRPPDGWEGEAAWREQRDRIAGDVMQPALARWVELLRELLPRARSADEPGLAHLPGGEDDYAKCVWSYTTLPLDPEEIHRIGHEEIEVLEERALELGARLGLGSLPEIHAALRASSGSRAPADAMVAATAAIRRAEERAGEFFSPPLPAPCEVTAMPSVVASSGMAPHYTPPRLDGGRPGTFWFNLERPTAGTGWDLEGVAFHEAVPGHHLQLSRLQMLDDLPVMQRQRSLSAFAEGWALYAEQLAEEAGLYSDTESVLGAVSTSLMRAARLVVDTGLHARGWSRQRALDYFAAHVPAPEGFLASEIDRYIVMPGQALSYLIGKREVLRLRDEARGRLGPRFTLTGFHDTVLDSGSLPLPVLDRKIERWSSAA
ncbi:MAG TPA: DUF885 domain-containing protein [Solirubrobacteraceae bacterium]|nr:DUF885 domain-containing protein [Solirubrobacteraceae bacterium]